jgi:hypothetical protein
MAIDFPRTSLVYFVVPDCSLLIFVFLGRHLFPSLFGLQDPAERPSASDILSMPKVVAVMEIGEIQPAAPASNPLKMAREKRRTELEYEIPPSQRPQQFLFRFPALDQFETVSLTSSSPLIDGHKLELKDDEEEWQDSLALPPGRYVFHFTVNDILPMTSPLHDSDGDENALVLVDELHTLVTSLCEHASQLPTARFVPPSTPSLDFDLYSLFFFCL